MRRAPGLLALALAAPLAAQTSWSPLAPTADVSRTLFTAPLPAELVLERHRPLGLFATAGNPAAAVFDLETTFSSYRVGLSHAGGTYRRPLDLQTASAPGVAVAAEARVTDRFAAAGGVALDAVAANPSSYAHELLPYGSSPLAEADTSTSAVRRPAARLDGALAWRAGRWGFGGAVSYEAVDNRTLETRLPRFGHASFPAAALGVVRVLGPVTLGLRARYVYGYEHFHIVAHGANGTAYDLQGLSDPQVRTISSASDYFRRYLRDGTGVQASAAGHAAGIAWVADVERVNQREEQTSIEFSAHPPYDRWRAEGWHYDAAVRHALPWSWGELTGRLSSLSFDGAAVLASVRGIFYESHESLLDLAGEWRWSPADSSWRLGATLATRHHVLNQQDFLSLRTASLDAWEPAFTFSAAHRMHSGVWWEAGTGMAWHYAASSFPDPDSTSLPYQKYVAPALSLEATRASGHSYRIAFMGPLKETAHWWATVDYTISHPAFHATILPRGPVPSARRGDVMLTTGIAVGL